MDIKEYRYILEVAERGGISKAAETLHISQPSLSGYIKNIEKRIGVELFSNVRGRIVPTPSGEIYIEHARRIIGMDAALMEQLDGIKENRAGIVRLGVTSTPSPIIIPTLMRRLEEEFPDVDVRFTEGVSAELEDMATERRKLDIILASTPFSHQELKMRLLFKEQVVLAVPEVYARKIGGIRKEGFDYTWIPVESLRNLPFTLFKPGHKLRQIADSFFFSNGIVPNILHETQSSATALGLVEQGLAATFVYDSYLIATRPIKDVVLYSFGDKPIVLEFVAAYMDEALKSGPVEAVLESIVRNIQSVYSEIQA